jgi:arsenate reductase
LRARVRLRVLLGRRALAEAVGTAGLLAAVVGSGIAATRLSPADVGLQLLENSIATALALFALITALGPVSGAHLNPIVTAMERLRGRLSTREAVAYAGAQFAGGAVGALLANAMFERPVFETATRVRSGPGLWLGEVVATAGLLVTIRGAEARGAKAIPAAVAAYVGAAYWFTSSTSFANPAVTTARALSDSFAGIAPASVPAFVLAQAIGGALGIALLAALRPGGDARTRRSGDTGDAA